jgi:hypothetical protein
MREFIKNPSENIADNFDKFVFYACVIDTLFLPYVWFISVPYTMPLTFYWFLRRYKKLNESKEYKLFLIIFILMSISTMFSFILAPQYIYKNLVYLIQFTTMFLYYFIFVYYLKQFDFKVKNFLIVFIVSVVILALFYNIDKSFYHKVVLFWNHRSGISINELSYANFVGYRYSFIWMDANNIGYMMNAIVLYLWCNEKTSFFIKTFSLLSLLFVLISCMSNGGFLVFAFNIIVFIIVELIQLVKGKYKLKFQITPTSLFLFLITVLSLISIIPQIPKYLETGVALEALERIDRNSGDSRIRIWQYIIQKVNFLEYVLWGKGGVTLVDGSKFSPHNGHFYWILGYGFVSYFIFMYLVFRKRKRTSLKQYIWVLSILIGFTVNILLGEIKMMGIVMLLVACSSSQKYLEARGS